MEITIAGLGKVGSYLSTTLAKEGHNITVVDTNSKKVNEATTDTDVMGLSGNIVDSSVLNDLNLEKCDLFIALTASDEVNLLSCLLAKKEGCKRTIARVRTPEYAQSLGYFKDQLGIDLVINPEQLAAQEIEQVLSLPGAIDVDDFRQKKGKIYKFRIKPGSLLDGMLVKNVPSMVNSDVLVCVDERDKKAYIPDGSFRLQAHDLLYIAGNSVAAKECISKAGIPCPQIEEVMIIGASKIAHYLVSLLGKGGIKSVVLERNLNVGEAFEISHPKVRVVHADAADKEAMENNGLKAVDALVALTGLDEENVFLSLYAQRKVGIKTVTKVTRDAYSEIIEDLDLDTIINTKKLIAEYVIRYVRALDNSSGNIETIHKLANDKVEAIEFIVPEGSPVIGIPLSQLDLKPQVLITLITREGEVILPRGNDQMMAQDSVVIITTQQDFYDISNILKSSNEKDSSHLPTPSSSKGSFPTKLFSRSRRKK